MKTGLIWTVPLFLLFILAGCGAQGKDNAITPGGPTRTVEVITTSTPTPIPTPPKELTIVSQGFAQEGRTFIASFELQNGSPDMAAEQVNYLVTLFDKNGVKIYEKQLAIGLVMPGQKLGISNSIRLPENQVADKMELRLMDVQLNLTEALPMPTVKEALVATDTQGTFVTGLVTNPYTHPLENLVVNVLAWDASGQLIGGGTQSIYIINSKSTSGVQVTLVTKGSIDHVDLYAALPNKAAAMPSYETLAGQEVILDASGFGQQGTSGSYGILITNPSTINYNQGSKFHVTAFSADGTVLAAVNGQVPLLLPKQKLGLAGSLDLPPSTVIDHLDIQVQTGEYQPSDPKLKLTFDKAAFAPGTPGKATAIMLNPYANYAFKRLRVYALALDPSGRIVGGGMTVLEQVAANSKTPVEIEIPTSATVARVEFFASPRNLDAFK